ncbi:MAG: ABC transporter substrate-binding protein [Chloroflexi bacterium]|nr:ABC transporter substrate-binding protein [Chloroflexota bacterium]
MKRREFLRVTAMTAVGALAASCAQPTPQIIEKEVPIEKIVKETVVVEKQVPVEKIVKETVVVQREIAVEKVVTATPIPAKFHEAPMLAELVKAGKLPPVEERVGEDPRVITPHEEIGQYGGTWHCLAVGPQDLELSSRFNYPSLLRFNATGSGVVADVCSSWEANADSSVYTFKLRKGMKWSDGAKYSTADWAFWMDDMIGNDDLYPAKPVLLMPHGKLVTMEVVDDWTLRFDFHGSYALLPLVLGDAHTELHANIPSHYLKQFHVKHAIKTQLDAATKAGGFEFWYQLFANKNDQHVNPERPTIGAWKLEEAPPAQPVSAMRNPYYWKVDPDGNQLPYLDRIEWILVENGDVVNLRAAAGDVDMQLRHILFSNYPIFKESAAKADFRVLDWLWGENEIVIHVTQDSVDPMKKLLLEDKRFRFALSLAINRQEVCDGIYFGTVEPSQIVPYKESPWWTPERAMHMAQYDPDKANAYLDEMGLTKRDSEGYRLMPDGNRLVIYWDYCTLFGAWRPCGELVREHYRKVGIDLQLREVARQLFYERFQARETDLGLWSGHATFFPVMRPRDFVAIFRNGSKWAAQYAQWYETHGKAGVEPPADSDIRKGQLLYDQVVGSSSLKEAYEKFNAVLDIFYDNLWTLGVTTPPVQPVIVKNKFRNVPNNVLSTNSLMSPGAAEPEQFFWKK